MKNQLTSRILTTRISLLALGSLSGVTYAQSTRIWDGGGVAGTNMDTAVNWSADTVPNGVAPGDTAQWNGTVTGPLALTYTAGGTPGSNLGAGNGIFLSVLGTQTDSLTITQASGTTALRLQNLTIASGAGAFTFGNANAFTDGITLGSGSVNAHTFTNNSSNMATFGADVRFAFGGAGAKTTTFTGSGNWTFSGKYGNNGTGSITSIFKAGAGTLTINSNIQGTNSGAVAVNPGNFHVNGGTVVIDTGGVVTTTNFSSIGLQGTDVATMTLKGNGSFNSSASDFNIGDVGSASGTLNVQDTASLVVGTGGGFFVGSANTGGSTASGTVNHSAGTITVNRTNDGAFVIGGRNSATTGGSGTYNLSGTGVLANAGNAFIGGYGTGTFNQSAGTFNNTGWVSIGRQTGGTGNYNISGGNLNQTAAGLGIVVGEVGTGTLTVSATGAVTTTPTGSMFVGNGAAGNGTVNLNGGTITTPKVSTAGGTSTFNFNGGTLKTNAANTTYFQGLTSTNVRNGGALIDTNGFNLTIGQALLHSAIGGDAATDGGLTKSGTGTLTLSGASTYNGPTSVGNGGLVFGGSSNTGNISVSDGATLGGKVTNINASAVSNASNPNLTLGTAGATNLALDFNTLGNPTAPVFNLGTGVVTLNGVVSVSLANTTALTSTPNSTTLALIGYGSQGGSGSWNLTTPSAGHTTFALNPTANALYLNVTANPITWTGALSTAWNDDALGAPNNWSLPDTSGTDYINGDTVSFTNTAGNFNVDITENVSPGSVNFTNTSNAYTIGSTGGFGITTGSVSLNGSGSVTINNSNSYTGATTINGGTLTLNGSLTASAVTLNSGALNVNSTTALGPAALTINSGTLDSASGVALSTNPPENWNGDFAFAGSSSLDMGTGVVTLGGSGDRSVNVSGALAVGELKSAATQGFTKQGPGILVVSSDGTNTAGSNVLGVLNVAGGTLQTNRASGATGDFMAAGVTGSGTITNGAATERWLFSNAATGSFNFSGVLANGAAGALGFNKSGGSTQTLSGNNTYSGTTTVAGGTLILSGSNSLSGPVAVTGGGTLSITGTNAAGGAVSVTGAIGSPGIINLQNSNALGTTSVVTSVSRHGGVQLQGGIALPAGVTFITSNDGTTSAAMPYAIGNLGGDNTINGTITLTSGGGSSIIQSDSGSLTLNGNITIAATQTSRGIILQGASTGANAFNGVLSDLSGTSTASIIKNGAGTWTVSGSNTYTGVTTVNAGTLIVTGNNTGNSAASVVANATLALKGNLGGSLTVAADGILALDVAATQGAQVTRLIGSSLTNTAGAVLNLTAPVAPAPGVYTLVTTSSGTISAVPTVRTGFSGGTLSLSGDSKSLLLTIPNPSAYDAWALSKGLTGANNGAEQDNSDNDGIANVLEFALDGNPLASDTNKLPVSTEDATNFYFDFDRRDDSIAEVTLSFEYGTLTPGLPSSVAIPSSNTPIAGPPVTITDNGNGTHHVKVTVAKSGQPALFGRLKAVK